MITRRITRHLWIPFVFCLAGLYAHAQRPPLEEKVNTAGGRLVVSSSPKVTPESLGVAVFPGAQIVDGSEYLVKTEEGQLVLHRIRATLRSKAPRTKVEKFYRNALRGGGYTLKKAEGKAVVWKSDAGKVWIITITAGPDKDTTIEVRHAAQHGEVQPEFPRREPGSPTRPRLPRSA